jgi:hypothetical protein
MLLAVDFGRLFFTYIAVNNAAREGAFYAADHASDSDYDPVTYNRGVSDAAEREVNMQGQGGEGTLSVSAPTCFDPLTLATMDCDVAAAFAPGIGNQVSVSVQQPFTFITPLIGDMFGGQLTMSATATAPVLNPLAALIVEGPSMPPAPTPTPTATPTATPTPTPTPTLPPGATPTPTPTPTPVPTPPTCIVPNFVGGFWNNVGGIPAEEVWENAGFTGKLTDRAQKSPIVRQYPHAALTTVLCSSNLTVDKN